MAVSQVNWRVPLVSVLVGGGALWAGLFGVMCAAFAGDASPSAFGMNCFILWGVLGGASVGALPGLVIGRLMGMKRLRWLLSAAMGTAAGAAFAMVLGETPGNINSRGAVYAVTTLAGAALGSLPFVLHLVGRYGGE